MDPKVAQELSFRCKEYLNGLRLPSELSSRLEEKIEQSDVGVGDTFKVVDEEGSPIKVVVQEALRPCQNVWIIPHTLSITRSKLYHELSTSEDVYSQCQKSMRLPEGSGVDEIFHNFWRWCFPDAPDMDEEWPVEVSWHLQPPVTLWIPHADDGNVAVCPLPRNITELMKPGIAPHGASMLCVLAPLRSNQPLKRDLLPIKRTVQRVARLITLIGDDEHRWAHATECQGLKQVCSAPPSPPLWEPLRHADREDIRPQLAETEFTPKVLKVFTDYPQVQEALSHKSFTVVHKFEDCHILFAANPVAGFFGLGQRMVNQFPHEQCMINSRLFIHTLRQAVHSQNEGGRDGAGAASKWPSCFPVMFDLKTEVNHFLAEYNKAKQAGKQNFWLVKSADMGSCDWCITDDVFTIVKYIEACNGNWVAQRLVHPPMLMNGRKFVLGCYVLVKSFSPVTAWMYRRLYGRVASKPYQIVVGSLADPDVHIPDEMPLSKPLFPEDVEKMVSGYGISWSDAEQQITQAVLELLKAAKPQMGRWPRSRALYRVDMVIPRPAKNGKIFPQIMGTQFAPELDMVLKQNPGFVNDAFQVLFMEDAIPDSMLSVSEGVSQTVVAVTSNAPSRF